MIRTHILPCELPHEQADALNRQSGSIYTGVLVAHWRVYRKKGLWLSEGSAKRWSDLRTDVRMHCHSIDAAQEGFRKACVTTIALHKAGFIEIKFPHWPKKFRTTIWKNTAIKRNGGCLQLSNGARNPKVSLVIPVALRDVLRFLEVRLVYDKAARRYTWHVVVENGKQPKPAPGTNVVAVDLGEIHPAVVGDTEEATVLTCRERRAQSQGHAKRLAKISTAESRKTKGSRRHKRLMRAKARMKAKHRLVMRDIEHKISRAIVDVAVERKASTIAIGDVRDIADGADMGKVQNGRLSRWNHGKIRQYIEYKAESEGIQVTLVDEAFTSQTCPRCQQRHKPKGRNYCCPACGFQAHRDVVGQINILSRFTKGDVALLPAPPEVKYRTPHNLRLMRRCPDMGQERIPVAREPFREAAGL
jgi:putative transposase